jgi:hypothetical protein
MKNTDKNFQAWLDESDIPMQNSDGAWFNAETGFTYADWLKSSKTSRPASSSATKYEQEITTARAHAKAQGWPTLSGTAAQRGWAEQIRVSKLAELPEDLQRFAAKNRTAAKFWIEKREEKLDALFSTLFAQRAAQEEQHKVQEAAALQQHTATMLAKTAQRAEALAGYASALENANWTEWDGKPPVGIKVADGDLGGCNVRVFKNCATGELTAIKKMAGARKFACL